MVHSDAFGPLTAELRRAEANHHDVEALLPRLVRARDFGDADDVAAVLRHRVAATTARPAGAGRTRSTPRFIAGLVPEAMGVVADDMRQALDERRDLITQRADAVRDKSIADGEQWIESLGEVPSTESGLAHWLLAARTIAAYRDRYSITSPSPLALQSDGASQRIDYARAETAVAEIRQMEAATKGTFSNRALSQRISARRVL